MRLARRSGLGRRRIRRIRVEIARSLREKMIHAFLADIFCKEDLPRLISYELFHLVYFFVQ